MPPGIKCRTCKIAKQVLFIEPMKDGDPNFEIVNYSRVGIAILIIGVLIAFL